MDELTTGQVARLAGLSEKAVRMYVDRGLLRARRSPDGGRRLLGEEQATRARLIRLLRGVELSLADIGGVLSAPDAVARFDELWSTRRTSGVESLMAGEYVRSVLAGAPQLDVAVRWRDVPERLVLGTERRVTLGDLPQVVPEATQALFDVLAAGAAELAGPPFVAYHERATDGYAARITVCAPVADVVRPATGFSLTVDPEHGELFVELDQAAALDQARLVVLHDYLSSGQGSDELVVVGSNREIYLPTWASGQPGPVMEVAVPAAPMTEHG